MEEYKRTMMGIRGLRAGLFRVYFRLFVFRGLVREIEVWFSIFFVLDVFIAEGWGLVGVGNWVFCGVLGVG